MDFIVVFWTVIPTFRKNIYPSLFGFVRRLGLLKPLRIENWFYFRLHVNKIRKKYYSIGSLGTVTLKTTEKGQNIFLKPRSFNTRKFGWPSPKY
jgi:hypothetical protein